MRIASDLSKSLRVPALGALVAALALLGFAITHVSARSTTMDTKAAKLDVSTFAKGLEYPWGMAFLPDGRVLVTERPGRLRLVGMDGTLSEPLQGVPEVYASGQGGLLDVALDPDFKTNKLVYLTYAEPREGGAGTAVARGHLDRDGPGQGRGDLPASPDHRWRHSFRLAARLRAGRQIVRHARRALPVRSGPGFDQRSRQDRADQFGRIDPGGQSLRR